MGKLTLWKTHKSKDYNFLDRMVRQQFEVGGTSIYVHKYLGPHAQGETGDETQPPVMNADETTIQDLLLLENRDRKYEKDVYELKGVYNINDLEFNLSQFGMFLAGDTVYVSFHLTWMEQQLGRRLMSGDVIELVHKRDDMLLDPNKPAINAFYVIKDAARSSEGYSPIWRPHIWRVKAEPLQDSQEYRDVLKKEVKDGQKLEDLISTHNKQIEVNDATDAQGEKEVPKRNFDSAHFYIKQGGKLPGDNLLPWVFNGDGIPPNENGEVQVPCGRRFPQNPNPGDYFLRTDYSPARLFRRNDENRWCHIEDTWRREYSTGHLEIRDYLDDTTETTVGPYPEDSFNQRQALSKTILPRVEIPEDDGNILKDQKYDENKDL